jgi:hypothetical protein
MAAFRALTVTITLAGLLGASGYLAAVPGSAAAKPSRSLAGEWISGAGDSRVYYDFDPAGGKNFNGYVVHGGCASVPGDIEDAAQGKGSYTGTENTFSSFDPCVIGGSATNTIQISANGETAQWDSAGCSDCGPQSWTRATPVWGFDTSQPATARFLASQAVTRLGHPKFVGQYLEYWQGAHDVITPAAVKAIHAAHARIMLISNPRVSRNDLTTAKQAVADADLAIRAARKLGAPDRVAIFRDVENSYHITASYVTAWANTITKSKYVPGFYENPRESGSTAFANAYCRAVSGNSIISGEAVLFSDEPQAGTSRDESAAPAWNPASPVLGTCSSQTIAWQYFINTKNKSPNIDDDEALPGDISYFW